jgi:hypothetical protein
LRQDFLETFHKKFTKTHERKRHETHEKDLCDLRPVLLVSCFSCRLGVAGFVSFVVNERGDRPRNPANWRMSPACMG